MSLFRVRDLCSPRGFTSPVLLLAVLVAGAAAATTGCSSRSLISPDSDRLAASAAEQRVPLRDAGQPMPGVGNPAPRTQPDDAAGNPDRAPGNPSDSQLPNPGERTHDSEPQQQPGDNPQPERSVQERILEMILAGEVPPVPRRTQPREVIIDQDQIYAIVNGEVISKKDILDGAVAYRLAMFEAQREAMSLPWRDSLSNILDASARAEVLQSFERKAIELVYRQEATRLRDRLGSIPREHIDGAIKEAMQRHGIDTRNEEQARQQMQRVLSLTGMSYLDFERQVREQIEATRVAQYYAFAPHDRFGVTFDISPAEMQEEYQRRPIQRTENITLMRLRFDMLSDTAPEASRVVDLTRQFISELRHRFDRITRRIASESAREQARQEAFAELAAHYLGEFDAEPEFLPDVSNERPEVAEEIRRTSPGALSGMVRMTNEIQVIYVIDKTQSGREPFSSPAVQRELRQRLLNRRWNDFKFEVDMMLLRRAVMDIREAGVEFNPE